MLECSDNLDQMDVFLHDIWISYKVNCLNTLINVMITTQTQVFSEENEHLTNL